MRSAVVIGPHGDGWAAYFGDPGGNVHAVDALTGKTLWNTKIDDHPAAVITGSPTLVGDDLVRAGLFIRGGHGRQPVLSCCSFRGSLVALDGVDRQGAVEDVHDHGGSQARRSQLRRRSTDGTFGGRDLVRADLRRSEPKGVRDYGRQLLGSAKWDLGRHHRFQRWLRRTWRGRDR